MALTAPTLMNPEVGRPAADTRIAGWAEEPGAKLGMFGAEIAFAPEEQGMIDTLHRFAESEMRPLGKQLDRMAPEAVIAPESPLWAFYAKFQDLGFSVDLMLDLPPQQRAKLMCLFYEELGWGDSGLAISLAASSLPRYLCRLFGNDYLAALCPDDKLGCWGITEPDHGSDTLDPNREAAHPGGRYGRPNCIATLRSDKIILNGQKSAWVSNGTIAQVCILYCAADSAAAPIRRTAAW